MCGVEVTEGRDILSEDELSRSGAARLEPELDTVTSASSSEKQSMAGPWVDPWEDEDMMGGGVLGGELCCS